MNVYVERPKGSSSFARCVADEFTVGYLTVTTMTEGVVMDVFKPGEWDWARMTDDDGDEVARFESAACKERRRIAVAESAENNAMEKAS